MVAFVPIRSSERAMMPTYGARLLFPTDLTSFLELIRQNGDAAYILMFAYATSHSLLLALFAGYAAYSGAAFWRELARIVLQDCARRPDRGSPG